MRKSVKVVAYALIVFALVFAAGYVAIENFGLVLFNFMFGNNVYVLEIACNPSPTRVADKILGVNFKFDIKLYRGRIPIEALLVGYRVVENDGENVTVNWRLHVLAYVLNHVKLFEATVNFDNLNSKTIYVYLCNVPAGADQLYVEMDGAYTLHGEEVPFSDFGGAYPFEA